MFYFFLTLKIFNVQWNQRETQFLLIGVVSVMRLPLVRPLLLVVRGRGAMEAAAGVFPPWLLPLWWFVFFVLCCPSLYAALHVWVSHQVDVAVRVALEANQHHT